MLSATYEQQQRHQPGERAAYRLACQAAKQTRSPKRAELRSSSELRAAWRDSVARAYGADIVAGWRSAPEQPPRRHGRGRAQPST